MARLLPPEDIMDTARWMAFYRAVESERPDALFHDPFARELAGKRGAAIARTLALRRPSAWIAAVRTRVFDEIIVQAVESGVDTVLNLAAGLDTRPYRLVLPNALRWIEVDFPEILSYKQAILSGERPSCSLESVPLDLASCEERQRLFARIGSEGGRVLVVTEGLLLYMAPNQVAELAHDLWMVPSFAIWLTGLASPMMMKMLPPPLKRLLARAAIQIQFAPQEGAAFFRSYGWNATRFLSIHEEAHRLKRELPLERLLHLLRACTFLVPQQSGGFLLLEPVRG